MPLYFKSSLSISDSYLSSPFPSKAKLLVLTFGWPYNKGEDNRKPSSGGLVDGSGRSIEVAVNKGLIYSKILRL